MNYNIFQNYKSYKEEIDSIIKTQNDSDILSIMLNELINDLVAANNGGNIDLYDLAACVGCEQKVEIPAYDKTTSMNKIRILITIAYMHKKNNIQSFESIAALPEAVITEIINELKDICAEDSEFTALY